MDHDDSRSVLTGAAGGSRQAAGSEPLNWVTLSVPNNQVEQILTASRAGAIHFVLPKVEEADDDVGLADSGAAKSADNDVDLPSEAGE